MGTILKHELKANFKTLLIWCLSVSFMSFMCILMFTSVKESIADMAESFASMGAFSNAFGMDKLSIATLAGFYATEVGTIHGLGGTMFAAIISACMLSKEEDGHTSEFLFSQPVSRGKVITAKLFSVLVNIVLFNVVSVAIYILAIVILGEEMPMKEFFIFHLMQMVMQLEIGAVCFGISAFMKRNRFGIGLGVVLMLYAYDLMARIIPDLEDFKAISPFSYANASDIFSGEAVAVTALVIGMILLTVGVLMSYIVYQKRDLAT